MRVTGGSGQNFAAGDDQDQFIVLGADDDTLSGGSGSDSDSDRAVQDEQPADYRIAIAGTQVKLTNAAGEIDTLTDVELIEFSGGETIAAAYSEAEAVAHHLAKTWLGRDLTAAEGSGIQNWTGVDTGGILAAFRSLPETIELGLQDKSGDELLAGLADDPAIIRLDTVRDASTGNANDEGYLPLGLALRADGGAGHDTLRMTGDRGDVHLEMAGDYLQLTRLSDGAMLDLRNAEAIAFNSGETTVIAHDPVEAILARLAHSFFGRDATAAEWQLGRETLQQPYDADAILDWFQQRAGLRELSDTGYIETIYNHTLGRAVTDDELSMQLARLENNEIDRNWLTVEIAQSEEAAAHLTGSVMLLEGWI